MLISLENEVEVLHETRALHKESRLGQRKKQDYNKFGEDLGKSIGSK